ncbi:MAG: hypothetical protein ACM3ZT_06620 [Bacillota bacterium]
MLVLTALLYWHGLKGDFALDDYTNVKDNPAIAIQDLSWDSLSHAAFSFQAGPAMRPLSMVSFAINAYFTGSQDATPFKATNLAIHLFNGLLVGWLLLQLLGAWRERCAPTLPAERVQWLALVTAAFWLVNPLNAMPVLYVVQRETALSTFFMLLGLNAYVWARRRQLDGTGRAWPLWLTVPACTMAAVLCKESGALLPVYTLVVEWFIFRFGRRQGGFDRGLLLFYVLFLLLPGGLGLGWMLFAHNGSLLNYSGRDFVLSERLMTEARVIWLYIRWALLPDPAALGLYHDDIAVSHGLLAPATTLPAILGIIALVATGLLLRRRLPLVAMGIAWFLGGQLMESTILPLELAYEHRCYLPDLGIVLALLSLLFPIHDAGPWRQTRYAVLLALFAANASVTGLRAYDWRDNLSFARSEARHHPESPYATYMLGQTYANLALLNDTGQYDNAVSSLKAASAVRNSTIIPDVSLVLVEAQIKHKVEPGVMERIAAKMQTRKISASDIQGLSALGECVDNGNCGIPAESMQRVFDSALTNPYLAEQHETHANIAVIYGNFLAAAPRRDFLKSRALMAQAAALVPTEPQYQMNLVTTDISMQDRTLAETDLQGLRKLNYLGHLDTQIAEYEDEIRKMPPAPGR